LTRSDACGLVLCVAAPRKCSARSGSGGGSYLFRALTANMVRSARRAVEQRTVLAVGHPIPVLSMPIVVATGPIPPATTTTTTTITTTKTLRRNGPPRRTGTVSRSERNSGPIRSPMCSSSGSLSQPREPATQRPSDAATQGPRDRGTQETQGPDGRRSRRRTARLERTLTPTAHSDVYRAPAPTASRCSASQASRTEATVGSKSGLIRANRSPRSSHSRYADGRPQYQ
jgi:hypothetical protein